jgi:uncharacterized protein
MFERHYLQQLRDRIEHEPRRFIQVLYGPRQVGKTTLVQQLADKIRLPHHFAAADAVPAGDQSWIAQQWEVARLKLKQEGSREGVLIIDEIQKIGNWSEQVKKEWDADTRNNLPIKVLILGSSRLLLQQGLTESLAGRFEARYMGHWSLREMQEAFDLSEEQYVWFGGYPGAAGIIHDEKRWRDYIRDSLIETSISKDILMLTRVDKPALMRQLFELGCMYSGQILSFNKIIGQLQDAGNTTTLAHYLHLLDTAGLLGGLEKFSPGKIRQRASSPKFQVHNTALLSAQSQYSFQDIRRQPDQWGRWVESAVGAHFYNFSFDENFEVFYWRHGNDEIDFVISDGKKVIGIEVKSGASQKASGMNAFQKTFSPDKVLLVGRDGLPWDQFLKINPKDLF